MTDAHTAQQIKDSFDALGLILVFVTVVFGVKYPAIWSDIKSAAPPQQQAIARAKYRSQLVKRLLTDCLPLVVITGAAWLLFLPLFVHVAADEPFTLWTREVTDNAFLFVAGMTGIFFAWASGLFTALAIKAARTR